MVATEQERRQWGWIAAATVAVLRHPGVWGTAFSQVFRLAGRGWWRRPPFLPLPDRAYLRFRLATAYGDDRDPAPEDLITWLRWCRDWRRVSRSA